MTDEPKKQPTTVQMPAVPDWAIELTKTVKSGFAGVDNRLDRMETTVDTLVEDGKTSNQRMTRLEVRMDQHEERAKTNSMRVKQSSEVDMQHDAAIALLHEKVDALASKESVLAAVKDAAKTATGQKLIAAIVPVLLLAISLIGYRLQAQVTKLEEKPPTVQVQPAPTVYVTAPSDGGAK